MDTHSLPSLWMQAALIEYQKEKLCTGGVFEFKITVGRHPLVSFSPSCCIATYKTEEAPTNQCFLCSIILNYLTKLVQKRCIIAAN